MSAAFRSSNRASVPRSLMAKSYTTGSMANCHARLELLLGSPHQRPQPFLCLRPNPGVEHESHPAAGHSAQHPEAIEIPAELRADSVDQRFRVEVAGPRDDGLNGSEKVAFGGRPQRRNVAVS